MSIGDGDLNEQIRAIMDERKAQWRPQEPSSASGPTKRYGASVRSQVFDARKGGWRRHQAVARLGDDGGCGWAVQPTRSRTMEDLAGKSARLGALGSRAAERPAAEPPLWLAE